VNSENVDTEKVFVSRYLAQPQYVLPVLFQAFCQRYIEIENTLEHYDPCTGTSKRPGNAV